MEQLAVFCFRVIFLEHFMLLLDSDSGEITGNGEEGDQHESNVNRPRGSQSDLQHTLV